MNCEGEISKSSQLQKVPRVQANSMVFECPFSEAVTIVTAQRRSLFSENINASLCLMKLM